MKMRVEKSPLFAADVAEQFGWYWNEADVVLAERFFLAVDATVTQLANQPSLGRLRNFQHPALLGLRSFRVAPPFDQLLIFYRANDERLQLWRLMHGARNLPRRLVEN